jgi:hypothetical protein
VSVGEIVVGKRFEADENTGAACQRHIADEQDAGAPNDWDLFDFR